MPIRTKRGFKHLIGIYEGKEKFVASCENCSYYEPILRECLNNNVLEFDMIEDKDRKYCVHWQPFYRDLELKYSRKKNKGEEW